MSVYDLESKICLLDDDRPMKCHWYQEMLMPLMDRMDDRCQ